LSNLIPIGIEAAGGLRLLVSISVKPTRTCRRQSILEAGFGRFFMIVSWALAASFCGAQPTSAPQYQIKAAYLYNFAKFVEWPPAALGEGGAPVVIGVLGKNPFGSMLIEAVRDKTVHGRPLEVRQIGRTQDIKRCHILFISSSEKRRTAEILADLGNLTVLTVGETEGLAQLGVMVNFLIEENKVRFEINLDAVERSGVKISSQLLKLAKIVKDGRMVDRN
jgi:hypothetical protein